MNEIIYRQVNKTELPRIAEITRQEVIRIGYEMDDGHLISSAVHWDVPSFEIVGSGEHSVAQQIAFCSQHMDAGAQAIGAFTKDKLIGLILLTPEIRPRTAQIAYLLVDRDFRRMGIGTALINLAEDHAKSIGAEKVYVSATPSESAVGTYSRLGFIPVDDPFPELFELEPDDIHMVKVL